MPDYAVTSPKKQYSSKMTRNKSHQARLNSPLDSMAKLLPHDLQAEQAVLGAILLENEALDKAMEIIAPDDFYNEANKTIFLLMIELHNQNEKIDLVTLKDLLSKRELLDRCGGIPYLLSLLDATPTSASVKSHSRIIRDKAIRRAMIRAGHKIMVKGFEEKEAIDQYIEQAESSIFKVSLERGSSNSSPISEIVPMVDYEVFSQADKIGIKTYFADLDKKIGVITSHSIIAIDLQVNSCNSFHSLHLL